MPTAMSTEKVKNALERHALGLNVLALAGVMGLVCAAHQRSVHNVRVIQPLSSPVTLPYAFKNGAGSYVFEATLTKGWLIPWYLTVRADDCIESLTVDSTSIYTASQCTPCKHCSYSRFSLPRSLSPGPHTLTMRIKDTGGAGVVDVRQAEGMGVGTALLLLEVGLLWMWLVRRRGLGYASAWPALTAMCMMVIYFYATDPMMRQHDVDGHREYVEHLLKTHEVPKVKQGWETWQPPLYYTVAALWSHATEVVGPADLFRRTQLLAGLLYVLVVALASLHWRKLGFAQHAGWLGLWVLTLIPAHVFLSGRVNNDAMMPLWGMAICLLGWHYLQHGRLSTVTWMAFACLGAMVTKTSSLSLCAGAGLILLWADHLRKREWWDRLLRSLLLGAPALVWLVFWFWRNKQQTGEYMYVNANLTDALRVANTAYRYMSFDYQAFLSEGHYNTFSGKIRESFPTALSASFLTGEFSIDWVNSSLQTFLRASFVPVLFIFACGVVAKPRSVLDRPWLPAVLVFGAHALFMISYNWRFPYACNQDARLWAPAYVPAALLVSCGYHAGLEYFTGRWRTAFQWAPYPFLALLAAFWWLMFFP